MYKHIPVLADEVLSYFNYKKNGVYVDFTLGLGGHAKLILEKFGENINYFGIDKDKEILEIAKKNLKKYKNIEFINRDFKEFEQIMKDYNIKNITGIIADLGVNSLHFDKPERGFSFRENSKLDMRMNQEQKLTAYEIVNQYDKTKLADIIYNYGEERFSRRIASNIINAREKEPITTTTQLSDIVLKSYPQKFKNRKIHPATKTFQALRIYVNSELENLDKVIAYSSEQLEKQGRICIISFHSLEDRIVKHTFRNLAKQKKYKVLTKKPVCPDKTEVLKNNRSRSAKLRVLEKI